MAGLFRARCARPWRGRIMTPRFSNFEEHGCVPTKGDHVLSELRCPECEQRYQLHELRQRTTADTDTSGGRFASAWTRASGLRTQLSGPGDPHYPVLLHTVWDSLHRVCGPGRQQGCGGGSRRRPRVFEEGAYVGLARFRYRVGNRSRLYFLFLAVRSPRCFKLSTQMIAVGEGRGYARRLSCCSPQAHWFCVNGGARPLTR
jgi:hypothetical protein